MIAGRKISIIGLGYVGLPMAIAFAEKTQIVAYDINEQRICALKNGVDYTGEVAPSALAQPNLFFTSNPHELKKADFHIVAVPTPIDFANQPDLTPLLSAAETVGKQIKKGDIIVFESTVYPGATEEECLPVLEKYSGLKGGQDFFVGYSPERINPGDKEHTFKKICKVVSGQNEETLNVVAEVYAAVVEAGVYRAPSIKVAEAAKVIENTQRDLNIALINELAMIFGKMDIDTQDVLQAAGTKWNFLKFQPGIVGGHCLGVDPYYLTYKASKVGCHPEVILAGRRTNDEMGKYIAGKTIQQLGKLHGDIRNIKVAILGLTFKENCPDIRNTKVMDIYHELNSYGCDVIVHDPLADASLVKKHYNIHLSSWEEIQGVAAIVLAVPHQFFLKQPIIEYDSRLVEPKLIVDIKGVVNRQAAREHKINLWRL